MINTHNTSDDAAASPSTILYTSYNNISRRARRAYYPASRIFFQTSRHFPWSNADKPFDARAT